MTKRSNGFTVIELLFIVVIFIVSSVFVFIQKQNIETLNLDKQKKTAINAMYYGLEEVFYPANGYYPQSISSDNLKSVDPDLFNDPDGRAINTADSSYSYKPTNCTDGKCTEYTLKTSLKNEADYAKTNKK